MFDDVWCLIVLWDDDNQLIEDVIWRVIIGEIEGFFVVVGELQFDWGLDVMVLFDKFEGLCIF